ncbi:MAG: hypothetical protein COA38_07910 [Fluviicola sp.]|nr:MAG: hypothetical protein COA38_07910 [Fluviicola sp.]
MGNEILDQNIQATTESDSHDGPKIRLPKDSSILTTGIIALPFSFGLIGIILSIVTLVNASKALQIYTANPEKYLESSLKKVRSGKVCGIISLSIFGLGILIILGVAVLS